MELVSEKLTVKIDGVVHELSYPTVKQIKELEKPEAEIKVSEICKLIEGCGLPKGEIDKLQASHLNSLVSALMGKSQG